MSLGSDAEWILSRKIAVKSLTRHFAPWKRRFFVLDRANGLLGVRSTNDTMVVINLYSPAFMIQRHEYSVDDKNSITVKYREEESTTGKEIVMKFDSTEHLAYWEQALHSAAENVKAVTASSTRALFHSFIDYINEQSQVRRIVESESQYEAQYYAEGDIEEDTGFLASSIISEADREQFIAEHSRFPVGGSDDTPHGTPAVVVGEELAAQIRIKPLPIPRMRILLVAVGTRGDMQPFVQLGLRLQRDGHRVRLATHACFRDYVQGKGLEFYPLAGDPLKLSEFMVKTQGFVIPTTPELIMQAPIYHTMVVEMMYSCWGACVDPDPADPEQRKFVADAIISNPVSYAHIHCAEALGIPMHLMFPQPWTPTKAFPHPLSCLSYQQGWSAENYLSYQVVDSMMWLSFERHINAFRTNVLGLEPLRVGNGGWNHLNTMKVPFVKMWSPSFVPKPKDWPSHVDVVGTFFDSAAPAFTPASKSSHIPALSSPLENDVEDVGESDRKSGEKEGRSHRGEHVRVSTEIASSAKVTSESSKQGEVTTTTTTTVQATVTATATTTSAPPSTSKTPMSPMIESSFQPPPELMRFLQGDAPVFVGFGSMVVKDLEGLISLFLEGAALAGVRIIVQVGWSEITPERFLELALQAQLKASIVRETEAMNDNLYSSVIFPSAHKTNTTAAGGNKKADKGLLKGVADLSMSMRSVESTSTVDEHCDESTLDGERLPSVGTRESDSALCTSSISPTDRHSFERQQKAHTLDVEFDSSPIPSPPRTVSTDGGRKSSSDGVNSLSNSATQGIGNWLLGAALNISKTFSQPSTSAKSNATHHSDKPPHSHHAPHSHGSHPSSHGAPHHHAQSHNQGQLEQSDISSCWDEVETGQSWSASKDAMFLGPCPHDWLFQRVAGVVHHGGAGTTAAGLRYGCPSWICPFFGDQHFWGEMVHRRKVGPKPCPIGALTLPIVADSLASLLDSETIGHAQSLAEQMAHEDGVEGACQAFYKHLPVENMICDVSLFRGEYRLAQVYCQDCGFKMCNEVAQYLHSEPSLHLQSHTLLPCCYKDWSQPPPASAAEGLIQGLGGLVHEIKEGVSDILYDPVRGIYMQGLSGAAAGLSTGLNSLLSRPMAGGSVLLNKVKAGIQASLAANLNYGVEPSAFDPLSSDSGFGAPKSNKSHTKSNSQDLSGDATAPLVPSAQQSTRIRGLKMALEDLPAVYSPMLNVASQTPSAADAAEPVLEPEVESTRKKSLDESSITARHAVPALSSPPTSPRGGTTILDRTHDEAAQQLQASLLSAASQDSAAFYGPRGDLDGGMGMGIDSDGDDSVYEEEDALPFLLEIPAPSLVSPTHQDLNSSSVSGISESPHASQPPSDRLSGAEGGSARVRGAPSGRDSISSAVNHSNDDSLHSSSPLPTSPSPRSPPLPLPSVPGALTATVTEEKDALTLLEAFRAAQNTHKLFSSLGADNGRFLSAKEFGKLMQRAVLRETAVRSIDAQHADTAPEGGPRGSLSAHVPSGRNSVDREGAPVLNETSINALIQMIAHNKRYVDFVDFSLLYLQVASAQEEN